jgi:hypothetical protein
MIQKEICKKLAQVVRSGLGGAKIVAFPRSGKNSFHCTVRYGGRHFQVRVDDLTNYPQWLVLNLDGTLDQHTDKVLDLICDMTDEFFNLEFDELKKHLPGLQIKDVDDIIHRLNELSDEGDDHDSDELV